MAVKLIAFFALVCATQAAFYGRPSIYRPFNPFFPTFRPSLYNPWAWWLRQPAFGRYPLRPVQPTQPIQPIAPLNDVIENPVQPVQPIAPVENVAEPAPVDPEKAKAVALYCANEVFPLIEALSADMIAEVENLEFKVNQGKDELDLNEHEKLVREKANNVIAIMKQAPITVRELLDQGDPQAAAASFQGARDNIFVEFEDVRNDPTATPEESEFVNALITKFHEDSFNGAEALIRQVQECVENAKQAAAAAN